MWAAVGGGGGQRAEDQDGILGADGWGGEGRFGGREGGREGGSPLPLQLTNDPLFLTNN